MRTLVHLSNLRIGRTPVDALTKLVQWIERIQPSLIAVTGNLTESASQRQLALAQSFLNSLPSPQIVVPGDGDIPFWDPLSRFVSPWENFEKFFGTNHNPYFVDNEWVVAGVRTAVVTPLRKPALVENEVTFIQELMATAEGAVKILVGHAPVFLPDTLHPSEKDDRVFRSPVDLFISSKPWKNKIGQGTRDSDTTLFVSMPPKGLLNFQAIHIKGTEVVVEQHEWNNSDQDFKLESSEKTALTLLGHPA